MADPKKTKPPEAPEEYVQTDDAIVGKAVKASLAALLVASVLAGGGYFIFRTKRTAASTRITQISAPQTAHAAPAQMPNAPFTDITAPAGITFKHETGAYGEKLLPETMGGGVAFIDFDGDGDQDLVFVNSSYWPWQKPAAGGNPPPGLALYRNDTQVGQIHFTDVTAGSGLEQPFYGMGVAVGDYDNDGLPDLLITGVGGCRLYHNAGQGKFVDVTSAAGVAGAPGDWSTAAVWLDFDNDGDLDLFVGNYVQWSREIDAKVGYKIDGVNRAYGPPMNFQGALPHLYRNDGGGKFSDVSAAAGVQVKNPNTGVPAAKTLGVAAVDYNQDGWIDLVVANDTVQNFLFENQKNGTFKEVGGLAGVAFDSYGNTRGAMGIDSARFTGDGRLGIVIGNFANEMTALYVVSTGGASFSDESISWGIGPASRLLLKFGTVFVDYDLDGRLDVISSNGHLEEEISKIQQSQKYRQPAQLFWNGGDAGFQNVDASHASPALFTPLAGRGSAYADIDGDGDEDIVITQVGGPPLLLRNDQSLGNSWIKLKLQGKSSNRDGVGAWIKVSSGGNTLWRQVMASKSYLSSSELPVTIGLGKAKDAGSVEVIWPGGKTQSVGPVALRQLTVVQETN
ncbi:MAG TPA: CRTAC1 family protein [Candidatus Limnocylindria bacterium]|nr:CRTAC1 family protein [Candidatus Limnocylindria bacterium]